LYKLPDLALADAEVTGEGRWSRKFFLRSRKSFRKLPGSMMP
jgi:hypothetical protein